MNIWLVWLPILLMLGLAFMQAIYVALYLQALKRPTPTNDQEPVFQRPPKVALILCLRGSDPSLHRCLTAIWQLDYPDFELHLAFDDRGDPAWTVVDRFVNQQNLSQGPSLHRHVVQDHGSGRGLKCSAIITTVMALDSSIEVVAFVDADATVESDWLTRLVQPLSHPNIGASTGNRWFAPNAGLGAMVRKIWNAAALPQMTLYRIPWGGSLALRRETIDQCQLLDRWSVSFCEDTLITQALAEHGLQVERVPDLIVVNRESTTLPEAIDWIGRQLVTVRLYHPSWNLVFLHAMTGAICLYGPPLLILFFLIGFQWPAALGLTAAWTFLQVTNLVLVQFIEFGNLKTLQKAARELNQRHEEDVDGTGLPCTSATGAIANFVLQLVYPFLAIAAVFRQRVRWRGITYRLGSKQRVEMVEYRRFSEIAANENVGSDRSIH